MITNNIISTKQGMYAKAKQGYIISKAPLGYDLVNGLLMPNKDAELVNQIFTDFINGMNPQKLSLKYDKTRKGIVKILYNPVYAGMIPLNNNLYKGKHIPIISKRLFDRAKKLVIIYVK